MSRSIRSTRSSRTTRRTRVAVATGAALVVVLGLSACDDQPGAAAYVGDTHISTQQVQDEGAEVIAAAAAAGQDQLDAAEVNRSQVNRLVTEQLVIQEAERRGITVSDSDVDDLLVQAIGSGTRAEFESQLAASRFVPPSQIGAYARTVALNDKLIAAIAPGATEEVGLEAIVKQLGALSEEIGTGISPRFGSWDPATLLVTLPPDDLSSPAPIDLPTPEVSSGTVQSD